MREHFCIGDFFVVDPASKVRFDEEMKLKENYDFTCAQLKEYGLVVCRFNRLLLHAEHYTNAGGAVDVRNRKEEKRNIKILRRKWPGVFLNSPCGDTEVYGASYGSYSGGVLGNRKSFCIARFFFLLVILDPCSPVQFQTADYTNTWPEKEK